MRTLPDVHKLALPIYNAVKRSPNLSFDLTSSEMKTVLTYLLRIIGFLDERLTDNVKLKVTRTTSDIVSSLNVHKKNV